MKLLETVILSFNNWSRPWTFKEFVSGNSLLNDKDKELFKNIWTTANDSNNWKNSEMENNCKITESELKKLYDLSENTISNILRATSYEWK